MRENISEGGAALKMGLLQKNFENVKFNFCCRLTMYLHAYLVFNVCRLLSSILGIPLILTPPPPHPLQPTSYRNNQKNRNFLDFMFFLLKEKRPNYQKLYSSVKAKCV